MEKAHPPRAGGRPRRFLVYGLSAAALATLLWGGGVWARFDNGFDLSDTAIPADEIHHGGPPKDGIPAIDEPKFVSADEADFLAPGDRVLALSHNGVAKAYPIAILNYHEIVNDRFAGDSVVVTFCPLCGTGMAFSAEVGGKARSFGVSGLLYNSDVLLYDRETESLWSQIMARAVSGPMKGSVLAQIPASHTTWGDWRERHPDTLVLSRDTGYSRDYSRSPYAGYEESDTVWFPVSNVDPRYHPKELVIGVALGGKAKAYPFAELSRRETPFRDRFAGRELTVEYDAAARTGRLLDAEGREIPTVIAFWFAWTAFHPETEVLESS